MKRLIMLCGLLAVLCCTRPAHAVSIWLDPSASTITVGQDAQVGLWFSDLPVDGFFGVNMNYNPAVVAFAGGPPSAFDDPVTGQVSVVDFLPPTSGQFKYADFFFTGIAPGTSLLQLTDLLLTDLDFVYLPLDQVTGASVTVTGAPVPEPGTVVLLGAGLTCLAAVARRARRN